MGLEIIDNFMPDQDSLRLERLMLGKEAQFAWHYVPGGTRNNDGGYHLGHKFMQDDMPNSDYYSTHILPIVQKLGATHVKRIKANLTIKNFFPIKTTWHSDYKFITTAIYYVNTNNGGTKFKNGKFVKSVRNRIVIFPSELLHRGVGATDENARVVINFNYAIL